MDENDIMSITMMHFRTVKNFRMRWTKGTTIWMAMAVKLPFPPSVLMTDVGCEFDAIVVSIVREGGILLLILGGCLTSTCVPGLFRILELFLDWPSELFTLLIFITVLFFALSNAKDPPSWCGVRGVGGGELYAFVFFSGGIVLLFLADWGWDLRSSIPLGSMKMRVVKQSYCAMVKSTRVFGIL